MLMTGENDWWTPMSENEQFYLTLQVNGVEAALVGIQDLTHSISTVPSNLLRKVGYVLGWFDRYQILNREKAAEEN
jgi:dipeptidyl aminopeptidase/acylaminoacyl peptidase